MPQVQGQAELHNKFQANQSTETLSKKKWGGGWRGRYHPNKNMAYCTADTRDVPTPHLSAPPTFLVQMLRNSKKLEKGMKEEKPRTWLSSS